MPITCKSSLLPSELAGYLSGTCRVLVGYLSGCGIIYSLICLLASSGHDNKYTAHGCLQFRCRKSSILEACLDDADASSPRFDETSFVKSVGYVKIAGFGGVFME